MPQDPSYPPHRTWHFAPPPLARRWAWLAWTATALATVALVAGMALVVVAAETDSPALIDDPEVLDRISDSCTVMTATVDSYPAGSTPRDRAQVVEEQNAAITRMIAAVESLDEGVRAGDRPLAAWLDDWRALVEARQQYARVVARGGSLDEVEVVVPLDEDGRPISDRMEDALLDDVCAVPDVLLDPSVASDLST